MSSKREYIDIYSHSGGITAPGTVKNLKDVKSSRILKSILCFFFIMLCCLFSIASYVFGVYIGSEKSNSSIINYPQVQSEISVTQGNIGTGIDEVIKSVVGVCIYNDENAEFASGVVISSDGYIITNDHVFNSVLSPKIKVSNSNGEYYDAAFIGADSKYDIAVIKIEQLNLTPIKSASSISLGEQIYCIGSPMNETLSLSVTQGIISGLNRRIGTLTREYSPRLIQTDAAINPGNSGGALVNSNGKAVGICCSKISDYSYENIGFAIPIDKALDIANKLIENGVISGRAKLGVSYTAVDYTQSLATKQICGIKIESIDILSDLYGKGFGKGDTITEINGTLIKCEDDFLTVIENAKPNDKVTLSISTSNGMSRQTEAILMEEKPSFSYR